MPPKKKPDESDDPEYSPQLEALVKSQTLMQQQMQAQQEQMQAQQRKEDQLQEQMQAQQEQMQAQQEQMKAQQEALTQALQKLADQPAPGGG